MRRVCFWLACLFAVVFAVACKSRNSGSEVAGISNVVNADFDDGCKIDAALGAKSAMLRNYEKWVEEKKIVVADEYSSDKNLLWAALDFIPPNMLALYLRRPGTEKIYFGPFSGDRKCENKTACAQMDFKEEGSGTSANPKRVVATEKILISKEGVKDIAAVFGRHFYLEMLLKEMTVNSKGEAEVNEKKWQDKDAIMKFYETVHMPFQQALKPENVKSEDFRKLMSESVVKGADGKYTAAAQKASDDIRSQIFPEFFETARCISSAQLEKIGEGSSGNVTESDKQFALVLKKSIEATKVWIQGVEDSIYEGFGPSKIDVEDPKFASNGLELGGGRLGGLFQGLRGVARFIVGTTINVGRTGLYIVGVGAVRSVQTVQYLATGNPNVYNNNPQFMQRYNTTAQCSGSNCRVQKGGRLFGIGRAIFGPRR